MYVYADAEELKCRVKGVGIEKFGGGGGWMWDREKILISYRFYRIFYYNLY